MSAIPKPVLSTQGRRNETSNTLNATFLKFLPAVQTHAKIQFRHLPPVDREEAIAEATAFVNFHAAHQHDKLKADTLSTLAHFAVLHARNGRHVGGSSCNTTDVLSRHAQRVRGFQVLPLPTQSARRFDCLTAPD